MHRLVRAVVALLAAGLLLAAIGLIGRLTREELRPHERYSVPFEDIQCQPPATLSRTTFLDEVRYLTDLPAHVSLLDERLPRRLADAFACHPWVEKVERVEVSPRGPVHVHLSFRTPVLAVPVAGQVRAVDRNGLLLPV